MDAPVSSREKRIKFIKSFGRNALENAIIAAVYRIGAEHFLTDDQLDEIVEQQARDAMFTTRLNIRNRNALKAELARYREQDAIEARQTKETV